MSGHMVVGCHVETVEDLLMDSVVVSLLGYVVPFLIILTIVVFVHEYGHYWVARRNGVRVDVFSVGFGK